MPHISYERLSGIVAGAFLFRAMDSLLSVVGQMALPVGEPSIQLLAAAPSIIAALVGGLIGYGLLLPQRKKWFYVLTIILLSLSACATVFGALAPVLFRSAASDAILGLMMARGLAQLSISLALIVCVVSLMKKSAEPNGTDNSGAAPLRV